MDLSNPSFKKYTHKVSIIRIGSVKYVTIPSEIVKLCGELPKKYNVEIVIDTDNKELKGVIFLSEVKPNATGGNNGT